MQTSFRYFGKSRDNLDVIRQILKSLAFKMLLVLIKTQSPSFANSSGLKSVFEKLSFRDGLMWTVDLTVEIKPNKGALTNY